VGEVMERFATGLITFAVIAALTLIAVWVLDAIFGGRR